jgi:cytochrome oxidase Cu insertion factor (SCO1/SenC/PrrC family)
MGQRVLRALAPAVFILLIAATLAPAANAGPGGAAPPFTLVLFSGKTLALSDLRGTAVVVLFWTPW